MSSPGISRSADFIVRFFVAWVALAAVTALIWPAAFLWFQPLIVPGLGAVMFGMGITLTPADFKRVAKQPYAVGVGLVAQFLIMPFAAAGIAKLFGLPPAIAAGLVLVGSCPGGTASNVMTYLAKGDVALSVTMTSCSTIAAVVATPYLTLWLAGEYVPVHPLELLMSILTIVIFPVLAGLIVRRFLADRVRKIEVVLPVLSVVFIVLIVACIVALSKAQLLQSGALVFVTVTAHNATGLALGYGMAKLAGLDAVRCRTIAIEVGMQNSGLGVALARKHFADVLVALPAAIFSVIQNITGPALANYWARK
ncbi:MAG TPA: bile acid:sodium symporter family protein [Candidatus Binatia bacterium]|jgi:BASS family bile acid:Na+ symporter